MKKLGCLFLTGIMVFMIFIGIWSQQGKGVSSLVTYLPTITPATGPATGDVARLSAAAQALDAAPITDTLPALVSYAVIVNTDANLRSGPGTAFQIVGGAKAGEAVKIVARNGAGDWYQLDNGFWIASFLVDNAPQELPVVERVAVEQPASVE